MVSYKDIYTAYIDCRRSKRNTRDALLFEFNQEENICQLVNEINNHSYLPTSSVCFYIDRPKPREIFAADFRDRVVQHYLYSQIAPRWERIFIDSSFACRETKGTHAAAHTLQRYTRQITRSGKVKAFYLKMDIANFFMSIDKWILYKILLKKCHNKELLWLIKTIIFDDPRINVRFLGDKGIGKKLPSHKSLFNTRNYCGLAIGNLTSQFFANVYLNELDQFVKHELKCRYYLRYVDDFILLSLSRKQLLEWQERITTFAYLRLRLEINEKATSLDSIFNGVDFVGFIVRPFYKLCRRRVIGNMKNKIERAQKLVYVKTEDKEICFYNYEVLNRLYASLNSYLGHLQHANCNKVIENLLNRYTFLHEFFIFTNKAIPKYKTSKRIKNLGDQVRYFSTLFPNLLLMFQVGCYFEAFNESAFLLRKYTGYKIRTKFRHFDKACGFHQRFLDKVIVNLDANNASYVVFEQTGRYLTSTMERRPVRKVIFCH